MNFTTYIFGHFVFIVIFTINENGKIVTCFDKSPIASCAIDNCLKEGRVGKCLDITKTKCKHRERCLEGGSEIS